jgi:hypothetical protein
VTGYDYTEGPSNVNYLTAPYDLLVKAFGNDGDSPTRDDYKSEAEWIVATPRGDVEIYDYKVGKCYNGPDGLDRKEITDWHVQGDAGAIAHVLAMLDEIQA